MPDRRIHRACRFLLVLLLSVSMRPHVAVAQEGTDSAYATLFQEWMNGQNALLARVQALTIHADVDHRVATASGQRHIRYGLGFDRAPDAGRQRGAIHHVIVDGDSLDVSERRRVERVLSSLMMDELGPLLTDVALPSRQFERGTLQGGPRLLREEGRTLVRFGLELEPPRRPQPVMQQGGRRPGMGVRGPAQGGRARPGGMSPQGRMSPQGGMPPEEMRGPPIRVTVFIDAATGALVRTRTDVTLPGERSISAETTYQRIEGIDLPQYRRISGDFPSRRRLRVVTVSVENEAHYRIEDMVLGN